MLRGPNESTSIPITIRAGIVSATLRINSVFTCCSVNPNVVCIASSKGAWLNHTIKVIKNAIHVRCKILVLPTNDNKFSFALFSLITRAPMFTNEAHTAITKPQK